MCVDDDDDARVAADLLPLMMDCNDTCCSYKGGKKFICFNDLNFTDKCNLTHVEPWELGVRWTFTIVVTSLGFFGNLAVIIILCRNRLLLRISVNRFILNMAFADFVLACAGPVPFTIKDTHQFYVLGRLCCHLEGYIQILVMVVSATSLSVISCDRMLGIVRPFHRHLKTWQADLSIAIIWVLSAVFALPFMLYRVYTVRVWQDLTETVCGESSKLNLWWFLTIVILIWIPVGVMIISYTSILIFLKCSKWRPRVKEHPAIIHLKKRVVRMVFVIVLGFIFCWGPFQGCWMFYYTHTYRGQYTSPQAGKEYELFNTIAQYLLYVNPAVNPIVYGLMHQTFQRAFKITFSCFFHKKSSFVLRPGHGPHRYVWSLKSRSGVASDQNLEAKIRRLKPHRTIFHSKKQVTPSVVMASRAAAAIVLEQMHSSSSSSSSQEDKDELINPTGEELYTHADAEFQVKQDKRKEGKDVVISMGNNERHILESLQRRGRSIANTRALGHLITQVIEEETSSDVDSERLL